MAPPVATAPAAHGAPRGPRGCAGTLPSRNPPGPDPIPKNGGNPWLGTAENWENMGKPREIP